MPALDVHADVCVCVPPICPQDVLLRCLHPDIAERPDSALDLLQALEACLAAN